jgi:hypothetical protein
MLVVPGVVMVAAMFFAWIDLGPLSLSGFQIARMGDRWLWAVPAAGGVLAFAAATRSSYTRWAALAAGLVVAGDVVFELAKGMLHMEWEGWMVIGGAAVILLGAAPERRALRAIGGASVVIGFLAGHGIDAADLAPTWIAVVLWAIAASGVVAMASAALATPTGRSLALASGLAIYALLLGLMVYAAYEVFGLGAWAAFGASAVSLVVSLLVPGEGGAAAAPVAKPVARQLAR